MHLRIEEENKITLIYMTTARIVSLDLVKCVQNM